MDSRISALCNSYNPRFSSEVDQNLKNSLQNGAPNQKKDRRYVEICSDFSKYCDYLGIPKSSQQSQAIQSAATAENTASNISTVELYDKKLKIPPKLGSLNTLDLTTRPVWKTKMGMKTTTSTTITQASFGGSRSRMAT